MSCAKDTKNGKGLSRVWGSSAASFICGSLNMSDRVYYLFRPALGVLVLPLLLNNSPAVSNSMSDSPNMTIF